MIHPTDTLPADMTADACRLNVMVNGDRVFQQVYPDYVAMMDDARAQHDAVQDANVGGFVVAQYQRWGEHGWYHGAILS